MKDFSEFFPNDLPEIPLQWEIYLSIELLPNTKAISIPTYQTTPFELKEQQIQLKYLLDKGLIKQSISALCAMVLLVKKIMGLLGCKLITVK